MADFRTLFTTTGVQGVPDEKPPRLVIKGLEEKEELWVNSLEGAISPNYQLMYAIGDGVFLNAFNQKLSTFRLTGLYVPADCNRDNNAKEPAFMKFYRERNIVAAGARSNGEPSKPTIMSFNNITITGFLVKLSINRYSKEGVDGHQFSFMFLGSIDGLDEFRTQEQEAAPAGVEAKNQISEPAQGSVINAGATAEYSYKAIRTVDRVSTGTADTPTYTGPDGNHFIPTYDEETDSGNHFIPTYAEETDRGNHFIPTYAEETDRGNHFIPTFSDG